MLKRNMPAETDRRKKISLPAALFNKSPMKNSQNNSLLSNNNSLSQRIVCFNHASKKGKYTVVSEEDQDEEQNYYCEKCAILLASRGFEVQKLELDSVKSNDRRQKPSRENQLRDFMDTVDKKIGVLHKKQEQIQELLGCLDSFFEEKINNAEQYFQYICEMIRKKKMMYFENLELKKKHNEKELSEELQNARENIELLQKMKEDIITSHQSIVNETPQEDYQLVMTHYRQNIAEVKESIPQIRERDYQLPQLDIVDKALNQLMGGCSGNLFSFDSQA